MSVIARTLLASAATLIAAAGIASPASAAKVNCKDTYQGVVCTYKK